MTYKQARQYIASLRHRGWRFGLDRMQELLRLAGNPEQKAKCFHVAGTNGKGSVTAMIQSILTSAGYRVGSFFSPYVFEFRERIQIDGEMIPEKDVSRLTATLAPTAEALEKSELGGPTEFEFETAMGFLYWAERECDYVALEVGLGGRLDATNVVNPVVSVITEIGLDHQQYLGDTVSEITAEKAGIVKNGRPVVSGASHPEAVQTIRRIAQERGSQLWQLDEHVCLSQDRDAGTWVVETPEATHRGLRTNVLGGFQARNMAVAVGAIDVSGVAVPEAALIEGPTNLRLPGRLQVVSRRPTVLLDGAHNEQAAAALAKEIPELFPGTEVRLVFSAATGHDVCGTLRPLAGLASRVYLCGMKSDRGLPLESLQESAAACGLTASQIASFEDPASAVAAAVAECENDEIVLVAGSFYLLSEALASLPAAQLA